MVDILWWPDESRWERRNIPVLGFVLSLRELVILLSSVLLGLAISAPISIVSGGVSITDRLLIFVPFLTIGFLLSSKRVKMVPVELQLAYRLVLTKRAKAFKSAEKEDGQSSEILVEEESFDSPTPISFTGRVKAESYLKVFLYVGDELRADDSVSPSKPTYRLTYLPRAEDIGTQNAVVKLQGNREPITAHTMTVRLKRVESLEEKKR